MNTDVLKQMLTLRGVNIGSPEVIESDFPATITKYDSVLVVVSNRTRINEKDVSTIVDLTREKGCSTGIIVVPIPPSETIVNAIAGVSDILQIFHEKQLSYNPAEHRKVPRHRILTKEESDKMMEKYHINIQDITTRLQKDKIQFTENILQFIGMKHPEYMPMPYILAGDAMARWIGAKPGDFVEILRRSETAGSTPYYRFCVANV